MTREEKERWEGDVIPHEVCLHAGKCCKYVFMQVSVAFIDVSLSVISTMTVFFITSIVFARDPVIDRDRDSGSIGHPTV